MRATTLASLGLHERLVSVLSSQSITSPTGIQQLALPTLLSTRDHHFLAAQTGTGKTLAYLLPILNRCVQSKPKALVLTCSRELVVQSEYVLEPFRAPLGVHTGVLYSGQKSEQCEAVLKSSPQIVYATMDRLMTLVTKGLVRFPELEDIVVDECDTLLDAGKTYDVLKVITEAQKVPGLRLTLVSATMPRLVEALLDMHFSATAEPGKPFMRRVIEEKAHFNLEHLTHEFILASESQPVVVRLLSDIREKMQGCILFCNSISSAEAIFALLGKHGYEAVLLHGDTSPKDRIRSYRSFRSLEKRFLVCTDLGSRGLDFPLTTHVIQCDFPKTVSDYLHRAGRAGRCYREGTVLTVYRHSDKSTVDHLRNSFITGVPLSITSSAFS